MCGIFFTCQTSQCKCNSVRTLQECFYDSLVRRGPDKQSECSQFDIGSFSCSFLATLLWLRGDKGYLQPITNADGHILLWNGDLFNVEFDEKISDTEYLFDKLNGSDKEETILQVLANSQGPGAYVYYSAKFGKIFFGRDFFGRHSLLVDQKPCHFILTSVANSTSDFVELPAYGVYEFSFPETNLHFNLYPWSNRKIPADISNEIHVHYSKSLESPVNININTIDSSFEYQTIEEYLTNEDIITNQYVNNLLNVLNQAVKERIEAQPGYCKNCIFQYLSGDKIEKKKNSFQQCQHSNIAILFSGGLDSVVLTVLAAQMSPKNSKIDLINVAFEQGSGNFMVPDRRTAMQAYDEVVQLCPQVDFNLVLVNVLKSELKEMRKKRIGDLIFPLVSVLDDSIGCAIWFASRGRGVLGHDGGQSYQSPARCLLLGMGADEQLGGYSKHKTAFLNGGREHLLAEVQRQIEAISERNLGRDNRVVSDHSLAGRFPYLDERVVNYLASIPLDAKMNLALNRGVGDKIILRAAAQTLGLVRTAAEPKRAIQFGSKIAKLENSKEKGSDLALR